MNKTDVSNLFAAYQLVKESFDDELLAPKNVSSLPKKAKNYEMSYDAEEFEDLVAGMLDEEGDGTCDISDAALIICGEEFYNNWDEDDLEYIKEVMRELVRVHVGFNLGDETMHIIGFVGEDED